MAGNDEGPSPLVPSIMLGVFGVFKYGPSIVSYLSFFVEILEGVTGGGDDDDEEGEDGDEEGSSLSSILTTLCYLIALVVVLLSLLLLLQETSRLYRQHGPQVPWRLRSGPLADWICWTCLLLVVLFIILYNDLM